MAKMDFNTGINTQKPTNLPSTKWVTYCTISDGDTITVRFPYASVDEFDCETVHNVQEGRYWRTISCLRSSAKDPIENCPFCNSGRDGLKNFSNRFFVKLLNYITDEKGQIVAQPSILNIPASYRTDLKNFISAYGDLKNIVFTITRTGTKQDTKYSFLPVSLTPEKQNFYRDDIYTKDFSAFNSFDLSPWHCRNLTADEMNNYLVTGKLPEIPKKAPVTQTNYQAPAQPATQVSFTGQSNTNFTAATAQPQMTMSAEDRIQMGQPSVTTSVSPNGIPVETRYAVPPTGVGTTNNNSVVEERPRRTYSYNN